VCPLSLLECNGACVDPLNDADNCGACGNVCANGALCGGGTCEPPR
jgi:hypothetical protein